MSAFGHRERQSGSAETRGKCTKLAVGGLSRIWKDCSNARMPGQGGRDRTPNGGVKIRRCEIGDLRVQSECNLRRDAPVRTAPVSHQKRPHQIATNTIVPERKCSKINETDLYAPAHNGLVAGSSPGGSTSLRSRSRAEARRAKAGCPRELWLGKPPSLRSRSKLQPASHPASRAALRRICGAFSPGPQWQFQSLFRQGCSDFELSRPSARPDLERSDCRARKPS